MRITYADVFNGHNNCDRVRVESDKNGTKILLDGKYIMLHPQQIKSMWAELDDPEIKRLNEEVHYWIKQYEQEVQKGGRNG